MGDKAEALTELFSRRVVFVMGKGGTGKSTLSAALSFAAESLGKRVLLLETDDGQAMASVFSVPDLDENPVRVSDGVWIARINPKKELTEYTEYHVKSKFIAKRITGSRLFEYLSEATPGLKEVMVLGRIWRWELAKDSGGNPLYDLIIVDSPATGHGMELLRLPDLLISMICVGPIVTQVRQVLKLLKDERRTWLTLACLPEELPVKESRELIETARSKLDIPVRCVFMNEVYPPLFTRAEARQVKTLIDQSVWNADSKDNLELRTALIAARRQILRRRLHLDYIHQLAELKAGPVIEIPFYFTNALALEEIRHMAAGILAGMKKGGSGR